MLVDAHHHVWRVARGDYGWLTPDMPIFRDYTLDDLRPLLGDIDATVLVQAAPTDAETAFLLNTARASGGLVRGVVGWTDLTAADASERIAAVASDDLLVGLRPMLQDIADTDWICGPVCDRPDCDGGGRVTLRRADPTAPSGRDVAIVRAASGPASGDRSRCQAGYRACGLELVGRRHRSGGGRNRRGLQAVGTGTEAGRDWHIDDLRRTVDHLLQAFGPDRLMWGSDWPVVELAGGYARWHRATRLLLEGLGPSERDAVMGRTACRFYGLASAGDDEEERQHAS